MHAAAAGAHVHRTRLQEINSATKDEKTELKVSERLYNTRKEIEMLDLEHNVSLNARR